MCNLRSIYTFILIGPSQSEHQGEKQYPNIPFEKYNKKEHMYIPASWHLGKGKKILVSRHDYIQEQLHFKNIVSILLLRSDHLTFVEIILLDLKMIIYSVWLNLFYLLALYVIMWTKFFKRFKIRYFQFNSLMAKSIKEIKFMA